MRKLPALGLALLSLCSCQYIPAYLCQNPFAAKVIAEVVEDVAEEIEQEVPAKKEPLMDCPAHLKAI